jgi:hypothetical protein
MDDSVGLAQPRSLPQLLRMLGVSDKPVSAQWHPIMAWFEHNECSRELWMSLMANGYGCHLEEQNAVSFNRPVPRRGVGEMWSAIHSRGDTARGFKRQNPEQFRNLETARPDE